MFQDFWGHFLTGGHWIHRLTLLILIVSSILVWAVILERWLFLKRNRSAGQFFIDLYEQTKDFQNLYRRLRNLPDSSCRHLFEKVYRRVGQMGALMIQSQTSIQERLLPIERVVQSAIMTEKKQLEKRLYLLSIIAGVSPFIGLFGTVWGVIHAFQELQQTQNILKTLGPGIAEALIATAAGLVPAIPALVAHRWFADYVQREMIELKNFSLDLINVIDVQLKVDLTNQQNG